VSYTITANYAYNGAYQPGYFYVVADDGSGDPSSGFLNEVQAAIAAVTGFTINLGVFRGSEVTATVAMTTGAAQSEVGAALQNYINGLGVGSGLSWARLSQVAFDAAPGAFTTITGITLNGGTSDLAATDQQIIRAGTITVR